MQLFQNILPALLGPRIQLTDNFFYEDNKMKDLTEKRAMSLSLDELELD